MLRFLLSRSPSRHRVLSTPLSPTVHIAGFSHRGDSRRASHMPDHTLRRPGDTADVPPTTPWFPRTISDLDFLKDRILEGGDQLEADHPGFHDAAYKDRRARIVNKALEYNYGDAIPTVEYTEEENYVWSVVVERLESLYPTHACDQFIDAFTHMPFDRKRIPQIRDISERLNERTGWLMRPVAGLLSSRDFINALAFKTFHSTQYIRHPSVPLYTPEPDIVHEFMGHAPMFADQDFADFSQQIGLASLGVNDEDLLKLARCYWFTVEFGLCHQQNGIRAYGAGLLSSFGELEYSLSGKPELRRFEPFETGSQDYPITTYQPTYFVAESFVRMKEQIIQFAKSFDRAFDVEWVDETKSIRIVSRSSPSP